MQPVAQDSAGVWQFEPTVVYPPGEGFLLIIWQDLRNPGWHWLGFLLLIVLVMAWRGTWPRWRRD